MRCRYATGQCRHVKAEGVAPDSNSCFNCILGTLKQMNERAITSDNMGKMGFYIAVTGRMMRAMAFWGEDVGINVTVYDEEPGPIKEDIFDKDYVV